MSGWETYIRCMQKEEKNSARNQKTSYKAFYGSKFDAIMYSTYSTCKMCFPHNAAVHVLLYFMSATLFAKKKVPLKALWVGKKEIFPTYKTNFGA